MKRLKGCLLLLLCIVLLAACGSSAETQSGDGNETTSQVSGDVENSEEETDDDADNTATLTDAQGNEIAMTLTEDYGIGGTYVCAADRSVWAFGGDHLAIAYMDEDGELGSYICELTFYQTEEDENGNAYLCVIVYNQNTDETSYWYVSNLIDEDEEKIGLLLEMPGDSDSYVRLLTEDYAKTLETSDAEE